MSELICGTETESQTLKTDLWLPKGTGGAGGDGLGVWNWHMHAVLCGVNGQWGPAEEHGVLYAIFCDNLYGKRS